MPPSVPQASPGGLQKSPSGARQVRQRSHADDVLAALAGLDAQW
jgi:hypothetical protein